MGCGGTKPTYFKPDWWLFTSDKAGNQKQFCIPDQTLIKDYGKVHKGAIKSITSSYDGKFLFTSDDKGNLIQWDINKQELVKDYGQMHNSAILSMAVTYSCEFLFTGAENGYMKQFNINKLKIAKSLDKAHKGPITSMVVSDDDKFLFTCCFNELKQWSISSKKCIKVLSDGLGDNLAFNNICLAYNSKLLFSLDWDGEVKKWDINKKKLIGQQPKCEASSTLITSNAEDWLFVADNKGRLIQFDMTTDEIKNEHKVHQKGIQCVQKLGELKHQFTADMGGNVKEWSIDKSKVQKDFGDIIDKETKKVHKDPIFSICVANQNEDPKTDAF